MKPLFADTSPEAERVLVEGYARMSPEKKLECVADLAHMVEQFQRSRLLSKYGPDISEHEMRLRLASLRLPRQTMIDVFAWDPEKKGY